MFVLIAVVCDVCFCVCCTSVCVYIGVSMYFACLLHCCLLFDRFCCLCLLLCGVLLLLEFVCL